MDTKLTENISDVKTWHGLFHSNKPQKSGGFYGVSSDHQPFCFDALGSNTYYCRYLLAEIILVQRNVRYFMGGWIVAEWRNPTRIYGFMGEWVGAKWRNPIRLYGPGFSLMGVCTCFSQIFESAHNSKL